MNGTAQRQASPFQKEVRLFAAFAAGALLLFAALLAPGKAWAAQDTWEGSGTASSPYLIQSASDMKVLADNVNASSQASTYENAYFLVTRDIDLTANSETSNWVPIGRNASRYFAGHFDGNGHTVTVNVSVATGDSGLFGYIKGASSQTPAVVENLAVAGTVTAVGSPTNTNGIGGICGHGENVRLENLRNEATVTGGYRLYDVGGIIGCAATNTSIQIRNCTSTGNLSSRKNVGGIVGTISTPQRGQNVIENCYTLGEITCSNPACDNYAGGIMGYATFTQLSGMLKISNCYSAATIQHSSRPDNRFGIGYNNSQLDGANQAVSFLFAYDHCYALNGTFYQMFAENPYERNQQPSTTEVRGATKDELQGKALATTMTTSGAYRYAKDSYATLLWEVPEGAPRITAQPQPCSVQSAQAGTVSVVAENPSLQAGDTLSYQWYRSTTARRGNAGDVAVEGATSPTCTIPSSETGTAWYYCAVTNSRGTVLSDAVKTVVWAEAAATPLVATPVTSAEFNQQSSSAVNTVSVLATRPDAAEDGYLSYQWYEMLGATPSASVDAPIAGANDAALAIDMTQLGERSYWCLVTNTTGPATNTATAQSSVITVRVNPLSVGTPAALCALATQVNSGDALEGFTVALSADLDMAGTTLQPIGSSANPFRGNFLGQGHAISNLSVSGGSNTALFGAVAGRSTANPCRIENFTVQGSASATAGVAAGVAARAHNVALSQVGCNMTVTAGSGQYDYAGGIVGVVPAYAQSSLSVSQCYFTGSISGGACTGGILGTSSNAPFVAIDSCYVRGTLSGTAVGGIVGASTASSTAYTTSISHCYVQGVASGSAAAGSIMGQAPALEGSTAPVSVSDTLACVVSSSGSTAVSVPSVGVNTGQVADGSKTVDASTLKSESSVEVLGSAFASDWYVLNDGYPRLAWQPVPTGVARIESWSDDDAYHVGSSADPLYVEACNPYGTKEGLSYQWLLEQGDGSLAPITGAATSSLEVSTSANDQGVRRFVCRVSYTAQDGSVTTIDSPRISVTVYEDAGAPTIASQPENAAIKQFVASRTLAVSAKCGQTGSVLTYQWYAGAAADFASASPIDGATGSECAIDATELGTRYYWCVVTNKVAVTGNQASATTKPACVTVVPYTIESVNDLIELSNMVNSGTSFADAEIAVTADVDLTGACKDGSFTCIGSNADTPFLGALRGEGHTITLALDGGAAMGCGLIGYAGDAGHTASVSNLTVQGSVKGASRTGGIVGSARNFVGTNLRNKATVTSTNMYAGGVVGYTEGAIGSTTLQGCVNAGSVSAKYANVGGIVGYAGNTFYTNDLTIEDCYNTGNITGTYNTGGVLGGIVNSKGLTVRVSRCYSAGTVAATLDNMATQSGAIVGFPLGDDAASATYVQQCYWLNGSAANGCGSGSAVTGSWGASKTECLSASALKGAASKLGGAFKFNWAGYPLLTWEAEAPLTDISGWKVSITCPATWNGSSLDASVSLRNPNGTLPDDVDALSVSVMLNGTAVAAVRTDNGTWHVAVKAPGTYQVAISGNEDHGFTGAVKASFTVAEQKEPEPQPANPDPVRPDSPSTPDKPSNPSQTDTSDQPSDPSQTDTPDQPSDPSQPDTPSQPSDPDDQPATPSFPDVQDPSAWYYESVYRAAEKGLITGYTDSNGNVTGFGPEDSLTRAQAAVILWRHFQPNEAEAYNAIAAQNSTGMPDVDSGAYYTGAANWAVSVGVINGKEIDGERIFDPDAPITREQLCCVIANVASIFKGTQIQGSTPDKLLSMPDAGIVSNWAFDSVAWGLNNGVINGADINGVRYIQPDVNVNRATMAAILMNSLDEGLL